MVHYKRHAKKMENHTTNVDIVAGALRFITHALDLSCAPQVLVRHKELRHTDQCRYTCIIRLPLTPCSQRLPTFLPAWLPTMHIYPKNCQPTDG